MRLVQWGDEGGASELLGWEADVKRAFLGS